MPHAPPLTSPMGGRFDTDMDDLLAALVGTQWRWAQPRECQPEPLARCLLKAAPLAEDRRRRALAGS